MEETEPCKRHTPVRLYAKAPSEAMDLRLTEAIEGLGFWSICATCGAVGYKGRGKMKWGNLLAGSIKHKAAEWNKLVATRTTKTV